MNKPETKEAGQPSAQTASDYAPLFAALTARLEHAENRYFQEQEMGDDISKASTRAFFLCWRDARDLVRKHLLYGNNSQPRRD